MSGIQRVTDYSTCASRANERSRIGTVTTMNLVRANSRVAELGGRMPCGTYLTHVTEENHAKHNHVEV